MPLFRATSFVPLSGEKTYIRLSSLEEREKIYPIPHRFYLTISNSSIHAKAVNPRLNLSFFIYKKQINRIYYDRKTSFELERLSALVHDPAAIESGAVSLSGEGLVTVNPKVAISAVCKELPINSDDNIRQGSARPFLKSTISLGKEGRLLSSLLLSL